MRIRHVGLLAGVILFTHAQAGQAKGDESLACPVTEEGEKGARKLFEEGTQREAADPERALISYRCAAKLAARPSIHLRIGVVAERLEHYDQAVEAFEQYLRLAGNDAPDAVEMRQHLKSLQARRDEAARRADEAARRAAAPAQKPEHQAIVVPPPPPSRVAPVVGWTLIGVGVLAAAGGSLLLLDAKSKSDDVHGLPSGTPWASDQARETFDSAKTEQTMGIVCLIAAPLFVAGGLLLHAASASRASRASSRRADVIAPSARGLTLRF